MPRRVNRCQRAFLAPLFAVLALLCGLAQTASAAFNPAAQNPHYGNFLLQESEASAFEGLHLADPTKENGDWIYDSATGVPVYVRQNPWTKFDPLGLYEAEGGGSPFDQTTIRSNGNQVLGGGNYDEATRISHNSAGSGNHKGLVNYVESLPVDQRASVKADINAGAQSGNGDGRQVEWIQRNRELMATGYLSIGANGPISSKVQSSDKFIPVKTKGGFVNNSSKPEGSSSRVIEGKKTLVDEMSPVEAARYERYWKQNYDPNYKGATNTRNRLQAAPGTKNITDQKLSSDGKELYKRETIYDVYGRKIGNNDFSTHGRANQHSNPHHHSNPPTNPQKHSSPKPGLHPDTPR